MNLVKSTNQSVWTITTDSGANPTPYADTMAVEKHSSFDRREVSDFNRPPNVGVVA